MGASFPVKGPGVGGPSVGKDVQSYVNKPDALFLGHPEIWMRNQGLEQRCSWRDESGNRLDYNTGRACCFSKARPRHPSWDRAPRRRIPDQAALRPSRPSGDCCFKGSAGTADTS